VAAGRYRPSGQRRQIVLVAFQRGIGQGPGLPGPGSCWFWVGRLPNKDCSNKRRVYKPAGPLLERVIGSRWLALVDITPGMGIIVIGLRRIQIGLGQHVIGIEIFDQGSVLPVL